MRPTALNSVLLRYIVENGYRPGDRLPTLEQISENLGVSIAKLREELGLARGLRMVEVRPGSGTRVAPYSFTPAVSVSALYAIGQDASAFDALGQVRAALEVAFWEQAVVKLTGPDIHALREAVAAARERLSCSPIQVPAAEHRRFHLTIFSKFENPFVLGVLEAYWDAYDAFGLGLYAELNYLHNVWNYHERIADCIAAGDIEQGRRLLDEHMQLLRHRADAVPRANTSLGQFE
jgi:DNA-binding FadR family transcriptional regulator